ncbi:glycosyltransferase family 2 protein [Bacillus piscicola]|uniref:glycosyltransferase family 2 protein n=1 Tax=Bacillus piscicola TaxID=1632684 RepID=UPI001F08CF79|nr:glycosyltransferase [Bacillus piscicola]
MQPRVIFTCSMSVTFLTILLFLWIDWPWILDVAEYVPMSIAVLCVCGIAIVPGFIHAFLFFTLLCGNKNKPDNEKSATPPIPISILIPAHNEEKNILRTIDHVMESNYPTSHMEIIVINDGSTDRTQEVLQSAQHQYSTDITVIEEKENKGKAAALNVGLSYASHPYIVTIDADTFIHPDALQHLLKPFNHSPDTGAVAGSLLVHNKHDSWLTRLQVWDYFIGIAAVKRQQSIYEGVLVAQGSFSAYRKEAISRAGKWSPVVGEDIVLTWGMLSQNYKVFYAPSAIGFTMVPNTLYGFFRQRKRWARGMFEGFRAHPAILMKNKGLSRFLIALNLAFPLVDLALLFVLVPGLVLALFFQNFLIVGFYTIFVIPFSLLLSAVTYFYQKKILNNLHLSIDYKKMDYLYFLLFYSLMQAPICFCGYLEELISKKNPGKASPSLPLDWAGLPYERLEALISMILRFHDPIATL